MYNLLIVDDELKILNSLKRLLSISGYNVHTAGGSDEALAVMEKDNIDIIICDEHMPNVRGTALLSLISRHYPSVVNIMLTGNPDVEVITNAVNKGHIFKFLTKPVRQDFLLDCLEQACQERNHRTNIHFPLRSKKHEAREMLEATNRILPDFYVSPKRKKIIITDDSNLSRSVLKKKILSVIDAEIIECTNGAECLESYKTFEPDIIFMDIHMPVMNGIDAVREIRKKDKEVIIIVVTAAKDGAQMKLEALKEGATEFLQKPVDANILEARLKVVTELIGTRDIMTNKTLLLQSQVELSTQMIKEREFETLRLLAITAEHNDETTGEHVARVGAFSKIVAGKLGQNTEYCDLIYHAAPLHDIGKISISENILNKPGKLTDAEFSVMMMHSKIGYDMLKDANSPYIRMGAEIALTHHEKYDGSGYPNRLKSEEIPLSGRIVSLVDVFDALTHPRQYKDAWSTDKVVEMIRNSRGLHFDPLVVDAFLSGLKEIIEHNNV